MDLQTWVITNSLTLMIAIVSGIIWVNQQNADRKSECELNKQDLANHKLNHKALEDRVERHENKIDEKLQGITDKIEDLRTLIIEKFNGERK